MQNVRMNVSRTMPISYGSEPGPFDVAQGCQERTPRMAITGLNPYLNVPGNADKAIALYQRALGAKAEMVMKNGVAYDPAKLRTSVKGLVGWH